MIRLRGAQFREDAGPLAHPVRPEEYVEINNFYTATVYEKGAEVIGMLHRLVGPETWRRALDLYFERHDGQACTIEDWLKVFEDASGRDLGAVQALVFARPARRGSRVAERWEGGRYTLDLAQATPPTPGQPEKAPLVIPVAYGLLDADGATLAEGVLELTEARQSFGWDLPARPVPSLLRGFSAPVILERDAAAGRARLPARPRRRPVQQLGGRHGAGARHPRPARRRPRRGGRCRLPRRRSPRSPTTPISTRRSRRWRSACRPRRRRSPTSPAAAGVPDPLAIHAARRALTAAIAAALGDRLGRLYSDERRARTLQPRRRAPPGAGRCAPGRWRC